MTAKDLSGRKFGLLSAIEKATPRNGQPMYRCLCDCGSEVTVRGYSLEKGTTKSCGCIRKERVLRAHLRHGEARSGKQSAEYKTWSSMKWRCENAENYKNRGIQVCQRWRDSYDNFLSDMGRKPTPSHSIDRIDNNGGYEPSNCRWATRREQSLNTRRNRLVQRSDGMVFRNISEAAAYMGGLGSTVGKAVRGQKKTAYGFSWKFLTPSSRS